MFFKIESRSATMYKVDTLLMMKEPVTITVIASQPEKNPLDHTSCVKERSTMAIARETKVRAMHTWVGSLLYTFMYLSEITAPMQEMSTLAKAKTVPTKSSPPELLLELFFPDDAMIM